MTNFAMLFVIVMTVSAGSFEGWSEWTESTNKNHYNTSEMSDYPVMGMECRGDRCTGLRMFNNKEELDWNEQEFTSEQFSEEIVQNRGGLRLTTNAEGRCPPGQWMRGFSCQYRRCDDKRIHCKGSDSDDFQPGENVVVSPTFKSDEGPMFCPPNYYIIGMKCSGGWCKTQQLICAERVDA